MLSSWPLVQRACIALCALLYLSLVGKAHGFDMSRKDNLAVYWGQDSAGNQQSLAYYCQDDTVDTFPLAFLYVFFGPGGDPIIDFANTCNQYDNSVFPGTSLANCSFLASDIQTCQSKGKIVTLSLGGATGSVGFQNDTQAQNFADQIWNMFLGGKSDIRPFGSAVLDGIDLDIESGSSDHYAAFVNRIRSHASGASKTYYVTAAPQCPFPDASIGGALNAASFDAVYVQFYNNYCGLNAPQDFNFETWDNWAKTQSPNPNVKVYIGAPGSQDAAGQGYVNTTTLQQYALSAQKTYSSFGGVMLWDASVAYSNNRYDQAIKTAMMSTSTPPTPTIPVNPDVPPIIVQCANVATWSRRTVYSAGKKVVSNGHLYTAQWFTQNDLPGGGKSIWTDHGTCTPPSALHAQHKIRAAAQEIQAAAAHNVNESSGTTAYWRDHHQGRDQQQQQRQRHAQGPDAHSDLPRRPPQPQTWAASARTLREEAKPKLSR